MAAVTSTVKDKEFQNWLKGALAVLFTKQGLDDFVGTEIKQFQRELLKSIFERNAISTGTVCNSCTTENVLPCPTVNFCPKGRKCTYHDTFMAHKLPNTPCPNNICQNIRNEIRLEHRYGHNGPSWKNTDARMWCSNSFEIMKCYMPPDGYFSVASLDNTDFNGTLSVIINNKRFQNKMYDNLDQEKNICTEAREVGRRIRHAADMTISDASLVRYIDVLKDLLSDENYLATDPKAKEAVDKLNQLKSNKLTITTEDISLILDDNIKAIAVRQRDEALQAIDRQKDEVQKQILHDLKDALHNMQSVSINNLDQLVATKLNELKQVAEKEKESLKEISAKGIEQIQEEIRTQKGNISADVASSSLQQSKLEICMKEDLIDFYRKFYSTVPVSPIIGQCNVPLANLYVQPPLISFNVQKPFGPNQDSDRVEPIHSLREVFLKPDGQQYKDIYIQAKAGVGKTTFVKKISMLWCQAHSPFECLEKRFDTEEIELMKTFDFLFMIFLKATNTSLSRIDDMIFSQVINCLSRLCIYKDTFLEDVLKRKKCLVVLDGLDEWSHPASCKTCAGHVHDLPHIPARDNCTVLITTRPWKLDNVSKTMIERHVEIIELDQTSSKELISNAVTVLNKHSLSQQPKTAEEFQVNTSPLVLDTVRYVPYILLQMICLWFDEESIGNSKCEIYSNILEHTLSWGLMKKAKKYWSFGHDHRNENAASFPHCLQSNHLCKAHYDLILRLGRIAFEALFSSKKDLTIVFDEAVVRNNITEYDLTFCLEMGLLSQTTECGKVASRRRTFSFQHKSVQEYFAAMYIQLNLDSNDVKEGLQNVCFTLKGVLQMYNIFIFLGGISPGACGRILQTLRSIVSNDEQVRSYRDNLMIKEYTPSQFWRFREAIRAFQSMQTDILQEIQLSRQNVFPLYIEDIVVDRKIDTQSYTFLKLLVANNKENIKSLYISDLGSTEEFTELLDTVGFQELHTLQKLVIIAVPRLPDLHNLISKSVSSLKIFHLSFTKFRNNLYHGKRKTVTTECARTICGIGNLKALMLNNIRLAHSDIKVLFETICERTTMTELGLYAIKCTDHGTQCSGETLNLSQHQYVKTLNLDGIPVAGLRVNVSSLNECLIGEDSTCGFPSLLECLTNATNLFSLFFRRMTPVLLDNLSDKLSQLLNLKTLVIEITELGDTILTLSPKTSIKYVHFYRVTMTSKRLWRFVESLDMLSHSVQITLVQCNITPVEEYQQLKDHILSSQRYKVISDGPNLRHMDQFQFETQT